MFQKLHNFIHSKIWVRRVLETENTTENVTSRIPCGREEGPKRGAWYGNVGGSNRVIGQNILEAGLRLGKLLR